MASLTISIDAELLEAASREAERRRTSLDRMVADYLATVTPTPREKSNARLLELIAEGPLGVIDRPMTREEIYAERTWPRS